MQNDLSAAARIEVSMQNVCARKSDQPQTRSDALYKGPVVGTS